MAEVLLPHGWQYLVVDIQWYEPSPSGHAYRDGAPLHMDPYGRLLPAPNRFPSAEGGLGFAPLATYVHGLGLKFGVHLMRGIPRLAVERNLPVLNTSVRAQDIADRSSVCPWNPDMFGVDLRRPGAQAYYDSVFHLFASWGVDYVKVDDIARPYHDHEPEIEAIRAAIDKTGRPMVLSLSPGETAITAAGHVERHANLWRISDDFWDNWMSLREQFARVAKWNAHRRPGNWPDADMLPFGVLDLGRRCTRFTMDEQRTVMALWSIVRSPLMFGGDMTQLDPFTRELLTNDEVLAVNEHCENSALLFDNEGLIGWVADVPGSADRYLALFNARDRRPLPAESAAVNQCVTTGDSMPAIVDIDVDLSGAQSLVLYAHDDAENRLHHYVVWGEPTLVFDDGREQSLVDLTPELAVSWWGDVVIDRGANPTHFLLAGVEQRRALGAHTKTFIEYRLPPGAKRFRANAGFEDQQVPTKPGVAARFLVFAVPEGAEHREPGLPLEVDLEQLGFAGAVRPRDLFARQELAAASGTFSASIPWHGAGLYRLSGARKE
jgi:hypothetical protein